MPQSEEEEDYMKMVFEEAPKPRQETSLQRAARKRREAEGRSQPKSKAEREAEEETAREAALSTPLPVDNKGFKMMAKFGFKQGDTLGRSEHARKDPIHVVVKDDKGGIGLESEKKRKFRECAEKVQREAKRTKEDEVDFREAQRQDLKDKKNEKDFYNAQRTAERLHEKAMHDQDSSKLPIKKVNILWRGLVKHREEQEKKRREDHDLKNEFVGWLRTSHDIEEDSDYKIALGGDTRTPFGRGVIEDDDDDDDDELEAFEAEPFADRLDKIVLFMRETHHYCFWCAYQYPDANMDGCPGVTEGEHD